VKAKDIDAIQRLQTIPGIGTLTAVALYACIGDVHRFDNAKLLAAYVGLVPSVSQSGTSTQLGGITKQGSGQLRSLLVQAAHTVMFRCRTDEAAPLQAIAQRIHRTRARRKIAVIALARHLLRIAYYVLRDGTVYDASKVRGSCTEADAPAA
jgi:transposase